MAIPPPDIRYVAEQLDVLAEALIDCWDGSDTSALSVAPSALCEAIEQLLVVLRGHEDGIASGDETFQLQDKELAELISYGIRMLAEAAEQAAQGGQRDTADALEALSVPLALWGARHGTELNQLDPVVNSLARLADQFDDPATMTQLYRAMDTVVQCASPRVAQNDENDPHHPWRVLLLSRAVVATESHQPQLMQPAFDAIVELLPDEATRFFAEGMGRMDAVDYPSPVRAVMQDYYLRHAGDRTLH